VRLQLRLRLLLLLLLLVQLEFVGLGSWFIREASRLPPSLLAQSAGAVPTLERFEAALPLLLEVNFRNGWAGGHGHGICKAFDLVAGLPTNTDMPW
jgi:hypothetical protein